MAAGDLSIAIAISAVDNVSSIVKNIASNLAGLAGGGALGALATGAVAAGAALVGVGVSAAQAAGDFQQALNMLSTSAGEAESNLKMVGDGILKVSTDTGTSTQQLTSAMYNIESGGQHGADGLHILQIAAEGAKTENADLTTVSKALMTVMTDYKMPAQDATGAMNGLIAAVQNGRTTLQDMSGAMGQVLPVASSMGIGFAQVAGSMDTLTNSGVPARQAAQNIGHVLIALESPSAVAVKSMKAVGLSAQEVKDTLVNKGLPEAFQLIEDHVASKFPAGSVESETALKNIVGGLVGLKTAAALSGPALKATEEATRKIAAAMGDASKGVMGWDLVQQGFNFQLDRAKAALAALLIVIGQQLLPIFTPIIAGFTNLVASITSMTSSGTSLNAVLTSMGISVKTFDTAVTNLKTTFGIVGTIIGQIATIFGTTFSIAIQLAGKVLGLFVGQDLLNTQNGLNDFLTNTTQVLQAVQDGLNGFQANIDQIFSAIVAQVSSYTQQVSQTISSIAQQFDTLASSGITWGSNFIEGFATGVINGLNALVTVVAQVMTEIEAYLGFASPTRKGPGRNVHKWGLGLAQGMAAGILSGIPDLTDAAGNLMTATVSVVSATPTLSTKPLSMGAMTNGLSQNLTSGANAVAPGVAAIGNQLDQVCATHATAASKCASDTLTKGLGSDLTSAASKAGDGAASVGKSVTDKMANAVKAGTPAVTKATKDLGTAVAGAISPPMKIGSDAMGALQKAADDLAKKLGAAGTGIKGSFASIMPTILAAAAALKSAWETIVTLFNSAKTTINNTITALTPYWNTLKTNIQNTWNTIVSLFNTAKKNITDAITYMTPGLLELYNTLNGEVTPAFKKLQDAVKPVADLLKQLYDSLTSGGDKTKQAEDTFSKLSQAWSDAVTIGKLLIIVFGNITTSIATFLAPISKQLADTWNNQLKPSFDEIAKAAKPMGPTFEAIGLALKVGLAAGIGAVLGIFGGLARMFGDVLAGAIKMAGGVVESFSGWAEFFMGLWQSIIDIFSGKFDDLQRDWDNMMDGLKLATKGGWDIISGLFSGTFGAILGFFSGFYDSVVKYWTDLANYFHINTGKIVSDVTAFFKQLWTNLVGASIIPDIVNGITTWFTKLLTFVPDLMAKIGKFFTDGFASVKKTVDDWIKQAETAWTTFSTNAQKIFNDFWTSVGTIFSKAYADHIKKPLDDFTASATTWATDLQKNFTTWGGNFMKMLGDGITGGLQGVKDAATKVADTIKSILGINSPAAAGPLSGSNNWIPNLMKSIADQIKAGTPAIAAAADDTAATLQLRLNAMELAAAKGANEINAQNKFIVEQTTTAVQQVSAADSVMANTSKDTLNVVNSTTKATITQTQIANSSATAAGKDAAAAGSSATLSQAQLDAAAASEHAALVAALASRTNAQMSKTELANSNAAASGSVSSAMAAQKNATAAGKDATSAGSAAGLSQTQLDVAAAAEHASLIAELSARTNAQISKVDLSTSNAAASGSVAAAADATSSATTSNMMLAASIGAATGAQSSASSSTQSSSLSASMMAAALGAATGAVSAAGFSTSSAGASVAAAGASSSAAGASHVYMGASVNYADGARTASGVASKQSDESKSYSLMASNSAKEAANSSANAHSVGASLAAYVNQLQASIGSQIAGLQASVANAAAGMVAAAQGAAAAAASLLAHSTPKEGPMKDDDKWMHHFMDNLIKPIHDDIPRLARACRDIADTVGGVVGGTTGGVTSPVATEIPYTITTGHSIPITILPPPAPSTSTPPVIIHTHVDLDGREIGKCVNKYNQREVHSQGGYRNK